MFLFGLFQLIFTLTCFPVAILTYFSPVAAALWQGIKFIVPLYFGAVHQVVKERDRAFRKGVHNLAMQNRGLVGDAVFHVLQKDGQALGKAPLNSSYKRRTHQISVVAAGGRNLG